MFELKDMGKYIGLYVLIVLAFSMFFMNFADYSHISFKIATIAFLIIMGALSLILYNFKNLDLHKVAFVIILLFGITMLFLTPLTDASDEIEHFIRSDIVSTGQISTDYVPMPNTTSYGYQTVTTTIVFANATGMTVFDTDVDDAKIDYSPNYFNSAFSQNPFYAYLAPGIGIFLAKLFDLNAIWMLWLGRLANIILYAGIVSFAIRKAPKFKLPLLIVSISPTVILLAASTNCDGLFTALALLAFSYFLYFMENTDIRWTDLAVFFASIVLAGFLKLPYLALSLLVFLIPRENFTDRRQDIISKLAILLVLGLGLVWSGYATSQLLNSWRGQHMIENNVNASAQISYLLSDPFILIEKLSRLVTELPVVVDRYFFFPDAGRVQFSQLFASIYTIFILGFSLLYPLDEKISVSSRIRAFAVAFIIYAGVMFAQYLTWSPVGAPNLTAGVYGRYFAPLLIFIPFIIGNVHEGFDREKGSLIALALAMGITAGVMIMTLMIKY
ncbi:DUF2142 domain-containing protein [Methanobrevibacter sp.]|uniref:DUF2142 domain-containing protein n=1 Tax=Methanobrevibacter sp. TaxID=66852 RepID=UPI00388DEE44